MLPDGYFSPSLGVAFTASADQQNSDVIWKGKEKPNMVSTGEFWGSRGHSVLGYPAVIKSMPWWQQHQDSLTERQS